MTTEFTPLDYDPFEGDFGDFGDRTLKDAMVRARKTHKCTHCGDPILAGETYRARSDIADGDLMGWKWCGLCCAAMVEELKQQSGGDEDREPSYPFEQRALKFATGESALRRMSEIDKSSGEAP